MYGMTFEFPDVYNHPQELIFCVSVSSADWYVITQRRRTLYFIEVSTHGDVNVHYQGTVKRGHWTVEYNLDRLLYNITMTDCSHALKDSHWYGNRLLYEETLIPGRFRNISPIKVIQHRHQLQGPMHCLPCIHILCMGMECAYGDFICKWSWFYCKGWCFLMSIISMIKHWVKYQYHQYWLNI